MPIRRQALRTHVLEDTQRLMRIVLLHARREPRHEGLARRRLRLLRDGSSSRAILLRLLFQAFTIRRRRRGLLGSTLALGGRLIGIGCSVRRARARALTGTTGPLGELQQHTARLPLAHGDVLQA